MSTERLITQFEIATSTDSAGSGIDLDHALEEDRVPDPRLGGVPLRQREHLVGHIEPVGASGRADALGGEDHVDPAARAEVEHGLALAEVRDRGRIAAAQARERGGLWELAPLVGLVQRLAEARSAVVGAAGAAPATGAGLTARDGDGRLGVAAAHFLSQLVGSRRGHQQHAPFRSATTASFSTASRFNEK